MALNEHLFDQAVDLNLDLTRVSISTRNVVISLIKKLEKELITNASDDMTDWKRARVDKQLREARAIIRRYYDDATEIATETTNNVASVATTSTSEALSVAVGGQVTISILPTAAYFETLAGDTIIQGATQTDWWARQADDTAWRFQAAVRQGLVAAETTPQIVRRVREVMDVSRRNAFALVHTSVQSVANTARNKVFDDNADILASKEWLATLDRKTCLTCGPRDGKRWDMTGKPIGGHQLTFTLAPIHFKCRCSMVPVTKSWEELGITGIEKLPESTRASMDGQVEDTTFEQWLKKKTEKDPNFAGKPLGKGRAEMWKKGVITFDQMIEGSKPLTLAELKDKYGTGKKVRST